MGVAIGLGATGAEEGADVGVAGATGAGLGLAAIGGGNRTGALAKGLSGAGFGGGAAGGSDVGTGGKGDPVAGGGGLVAGVWPKAG